MTIIIDDLESFLENGKHEARAEGYVDSWALGPKCRVEEGTLNLFITDEQRQTKRMRYVLKFFGEDGQKYLLDGFKDVRVDADLDAWPDNTTLYTSIRAGWSTDDPVMGQGILYTQIPDFLEQLTTFHVRNSPSPAAEVRWLNRFGRFFFGELWDTYIRHRVPGRMESK